MQIRPQQIGAKFSAISPRMVDWIWSILMVKSSFQDIFRCFETLLPYEELLKAMWWLKNDMFLHVSWGDDHFTNPLSLESWSKKIDWTWQWLAQIGVPEDAHGESNVKPPIYKGSFHHFDILSFLVASHSWSLGGTTGCVLGNRRISQILVNWPWRSQKILKRNGVLNLESTGLDGMNRWVTAQQVCCLAWSRFVNFFMFVWSQKKLATWVLCLGYSTNHLSSFVHFACWR